MSWLSSEFKKLGHGLGTVTRYAAPVVGGIGGFMAGGPGGAYAGYKLGKNVGHVADNVLQGHNAASTWDITKNAAVNSGKAALAGYAGNQVLGAAHLGGLGGSGFGNSATGVFSPGHAGSDLVRPPGALPPSPSVVPSSAVPMPPTPTAGLPAASGAAAPHVPSLLGKVGEALKSYGPIVGQAAGGLLSARSDVAANKLKQQEIDAQKSQHDADLAQRAAEAARAQALNQAQFDFQKQQYNQEQERKRRMGELLGPLYQQLLSSGYGK